MILKIHLVSIALSLIGFIYRGGLMLTDSATLQAKPVRIAPHIIDTVLLVSGIALIVSTGFYPWQQPWLAAKLLLLVAYIIVGTIAIKRGSTKPIRLIAWLVALGIFATMLSLAHYKQLPL